MREMKINELVRIRPELAGMVTAGIGLEPGIVTGMMYMQVVVMHSRGWVTGILPARRAHLAVVHGAAVAVVAARMAVDMVEAMRQALEAPEADYTAKMAVAGMEVEESTPVGPPGPGHSVAQGGIQPAAQIERSEKTCSCRMYIRLKEGESKCCSKPKQERGEI